MSWHQGRPHPPPTYMYDSSPYTNPPHGPSTSHHHEQRVVPPHTPTPYGPPPSGPPPPGAYGPPPPPPHHQVQQSPQVMNPPPNEYWYDQQHGPPSAGAAWQNGQAADARKVDHGPSVDQFHSPERSNSYPYYHPTSSTRGGRRPDTRQMPPPPHSTTYHVYPPRNHPTDRPVIQPGLHQGQSPQSKSERKELEPPPTIIKSIIKPKEKKIEKRGDREGHTPEKEKVDTKEEAKKKGEEDKKKGKKDGDLLSLLANVSSKMDTKSSKKRTTEDQANKEKPKDSPERTKKDSDVKDNATKNVGDMEKSTITASSKTPTKVPPTSPLQRRVHASPMITPNTSSETYMSVSKEDKNKERPSQHGKQRIVRTLTPKPITPTAAPHYHHYQQKPPKTPTSYTPYDERGPPPGYPYYRNNAPPSQQHLYPQPQYSHTSESRDTPWEHPHHSPVVVERNSFDSGESGYPRHPSDNPHHQYHGPPPPNARYYPGESPYPPPDNRPVESAWQTGPTRPNDKPPDVSTPPSPYPHYRWPNDAQQPPPSPMSSGGRYPGPPMPNHYPYPPSGGPAPRVSNYPTPSPYYHHPSEGTPYDGPPRSTPGTGNPYSPPSHHLQYHMYPPHPAYPPHMGGVMPPYTYIQHPNLEEKTMLRKKFSWKHFPEVSHFVHVANYYVIFSFIPLIIFILYSDP